MSDWNVSDLELDPAFEEIRVMAVARRRGVGAYEGKHCPPVAAQVLSVDLKPTPRVTHEGRLLLIAANASTTQIRRVAFGLQFDPKLCRTFGPSGEEMEDACQVYVKAAPRARGMRIYGRGDGVVGFRNEGIKHSTVATAFLDCSDNLKLKTPVSFSTIFEIMPMNEDSAQENMKSDCEVEKEGALKAFTEDAIREKCCIDVVFVHGLEGDPISTWTANNGFCWPRELAKDCPEACVWSFGYEVAVSEWSGNAMPLIDRARNLLAELDVEERNGVGRRPLFLVGHSFGGLLIKQVLRTASDATDVRWKAIGASAAGIAFLGTPHGGADLASWAKVLPDILVRKSVTVQELARNHPALRDLNLWFREAVRSRSWAVNNYCETQTILGQLVVGPDTSDPGIAGSQPIPLDCNHFDICKPSDRGSLVYKKVLQLIKDRGRAI